MLTEQGVMTTEVIFSDDKTERYLLRKIWDEDKPLVSLIMTNPSSANAVTIDMTVHYSISNLYKLADYFTGHTVSSDTKGIFSEVMRLAHDEINHLLEVMHTKKLPHRKKPCFKTLLRFCT